MSRKQYERVRIYFRFNQKKIALDRTDYQCDRAGMSPAWYIQLLIITSVPDTGYLTDPKHPLMCVWSYPLTWLLHSEVLHPLH